MGLHKNVQGALKTCAGGLLSSAEMCRGPHCRQGGSSGGLCRHVEDLETELPIDVNNVEVTLLH